MSGTRLIICSSPDNKVLQIFSLNGTMKIVSFIDENALMQGNSATHHPLCLLHYQQSGRLTFLLIFLIPPLAGRAIAVRETCFLYAGTSILLNA
jgi:hypothetical protein